MWRLRPSGHSVLGNRRNALKKKKVRYHDGMPVPPLPWKKGFHKDYTHFVVEVHVAKDTQNQVFSMHKLQHEQDEQTVQRMPNQGMEETVFGLLTATLRQESLLEALILMSSDEDFKREVLEGDDSNLESVCARVSDAVRDVLAKAIDKQAEMAAKDTVRRIRDGIPT